jgi:hypothetical protein
LNNIHRCLHILSEDIEPLYEESNIRQKITNLPVLIYISLGFHEGKRINHGARIKVQNDFSEKYSGDCFSLTIEDDPKVIGTSKLDKASLYRVIHFVKKHKEILLKYWYDEISLDEVMDKFKTKPTQEEIRHEEE